MDDSTYMAQLAEMNMKLRELRELRKLRRKILQSASEDQAIQATREMIEYLESLTEYITEPPPEIFETVVKKIILSSATQVKFQLKKGLELTETIERVRR